QADRDGRRLHVEVGQAAVDWDAAGRDPDRLYRGTRLGAAQDWTAAHAADLNPLEHAFLDASVASHDHQQGAARRTARRLRVFASAMAVLLIVAVVAAGLAFRQQNRPNTQAPLARTQTRLAQASRLAAVAQSLGTD